MKRAKKRIPISYKEFINLYEKELLIKPNFIRKGQCLINFLYNIWDEEYYRVSNTSLDCFSNDFNIPRCLEHLENVWKNRDEEISKDELLVKIKNTHIDKRRNKVYYDIHQEMSLVEFAQNITRSVDIDDLPQLIALIVKIVDNEKLSIPLINHFEYLKNIHYHKSLNINIPFNLLNYD
jgi:hypothetical protein